MTKKTKLALMVASSTTVLGTIGAYFVGNYFVEYMLSRKPLHYTDPLSPSYERPAQEQRNRDMADENVLHFHKEVDCEVMECWLEGVFDLQPICGAVDPQMEQVLSNPSSSQRCRSDQYQDLHQCL